MQGQRISQEWNTDDTDAANQHGSDHPQFILLLILQSALPGFVALSV